MSSKNRNVCPQCVHYLIDCDCLTPNIQQNCKMKMLYSSSTPSLIQFSGMYMSQMPFKVLMVGQSETEGDIKNTMYLALCVKKNPMRCRIKGRLKMSNIMV